MGVKEASVAQLEHQIVNNDAELRGKLEYISQCPTNPLSNRYRRRCYILRNSIWNCLAEYRRRTGKSFPYAMPMLPLRITASPAEAQRKQSKEARAKTTERLQELINLGKRGHGQLLRNVAGKYNSAHNSGFSNLIFSHWCRMFGAANPRTLTVLMNLTLPNIKKLLSRAQDAVNSGDLLRAHSLLTEAASEMARANGIVEKWFQKIESGGRQAEFAIKFYAAVAAGGAANAYNAVNSANLVSAAKLTLGEQAAVGAIGEGAHQSTSLFMKSQGESVTAKEVASAAFEVGMAGATPLGNELLGKMLARIAPQLATRIATKAVDRYLGSAGSLNPIDRQKIIASVAQSLLGRIQAIGMTAFKKAIGQVTNFPEEPSWNFWENLFAPLVGGDLGNIVSTTARKLDANKAKFPR